MYKVVGGGNLRDYHLYSWNKNHTIIGRDNFKTVSNPKHHKRAVENGLLKLKAAGKVGAMLFNFAMRSPNLEIVCWPGIPGEFICPEEIEGCTVPTIMWDPYKCFEYYGRIHKMKYDDRGKRVPSGEWQYKPALMPAWIVLGHELGHYWHYMNTSWYVGKLKGGDIAGIERENLSDHEMPLLEAAGLPIRHDYQEFKGGSKDPAPAQKHRIEGGFPHPSADLNERIGSDLQVGVQSLNAAIQRKQEEEERAKRARVSGDMGAGQKCEKCGSPFTSTVKLRLHASSCAG